MFFFMFNKKRNLIFITAIIVLLSAFLLSSCGNKDEEDVISSDKKQGYERDPVLNELGTIPICKETVILKIMTEQNANVEDFYTNKYTKKIEEYGNVKLEFELVPASDMSTKLNLLMNTGGADLPDIIISILDQSQVVSYGADGMIIPLNEYYENSSFYLKQGLEKVKEKEILKYITSADGNIYTIPRYNESLQNEFVNVLWIYKPWLDKFNLEVPQTLEEYASVLQVFKDNDMNGNGDNTDEIPVIDSNKNRFISNIMNAFIRHEPDNNYKLSIDNGKVSFAFTSEKWRDGIKYLSDLCKRGLFSAVSFTMDNNQLKTVLANEENKVGSFSWTSTSILPATSKRRSEFVPLVLKNSDGNTTTWFEPTMPFPIFFITKNCEHPEVAFRIGDLMCSEEMTIWSRWGEKGVDWIEPKEGTKGMFDFLGYKATLEPILQWGTIQNSHWCNITPGFRTYEVALGMVSADPSQQAKADAIRILYDYIPEETIGRLIFDKDELEEFSEIMFLVNSFVEEKTALFITGREDVDANWDSYISELKNMGIEKAEAIAQYAFDRMKSEKK